MVLEWAPGLQFVHSMNFQKKCLILILQFLLIYSRASYAETEGGICENCHLSQQSSNKTKSFAIALNEATKDSTDWVKIDTPNSIQTSQIVAGYPMGCQITSMLYTLKLGNPEYRNSYEKIPGSSDIEKIQSLVSQFGAQKSRDKVNEPAFSEKYGTNPNDLPWMFQSLVSGSAPLKTITYLIPKAYSQKTSNMIDDFHQQVVSSLSLGKPIMIQLLYTNPSFSHAVVITGIERQASSSKKLNIRILDPMTGKGSFASVASGTGKLGDTDFKMLKFSDPDVTSQDGFLLSISL